MIYKPTACSPFQSTSDLKDLPFFLECRIDSSNVKVKGYSIKIYNSDNVLIFPQETASTEENLINSITFIPGKNGLQAYTGKSKMFNDKDLSAYTNLNTGYNGSDLVIPFIVSVMPSNNTVNRNQLKLEIDEETSEITITDKYGHEYQDLLFNGGSYKWVITLYELQESGDTYIIPTHGKYYDMILTTGTVLGSNYKRIQSIKSSEIFADYYIQLGNMSNDIFVPVGTRVRIKSYDESFGYIYPVTGDSGFSEDDVTETRAKNFQIYELSNNSTELSEKNKADYVYCISDVFKYGTWTELDETEGNSFLTQTYTMFADDDSSAFHPFTAKPDIVCSSSKTRVVFIGNFVAPSGYTGGFLSDEHGGQEAHRVNDSYAVKSLSPLNGIYIPVWSKVDDTTASVRWSRAPDADKIGELLNKTVCVSNGDWAGKNITLATLEPNKYNPNYITEWSQIQINKAGGSIGWIINDGGGSEKAVSIKDTEPSTVGDIFYNKACVSGVTDGKLYLRPFVGIEPGMWWQEVDGTKDKEDLRHFIIDTVDTDYWYVTYKNCYLGPDNTTTSDDETFEIDTTRYQIKSFSRTSDENPFSFESDPNVTVKIQEVGYDTWLQPDESGYLSLKNSRNIYCVGDYEQENNISWQDFQWLLYDSDGNVIDQSEVTYDGAIEHVFYGLAGRDNDNIPKKFYVVLLLNTYSGQSYKVVTKLRTDFSESTLDDYPIGVDFNCDLTAVSLDMAPNGIIIPDDSIENSIQSAGNGVLQLSDAVDYHKVYPTDKEEFINQIDYTELRDTEDTEVIQLESEHIIKSKAYEGNLLQIKDTDNEYPKLSITLSKMTKEEGGDIILNPDRNKMLAEYYGENRTKINYPVTIITEGDIPIGSEPGEWREPLTDTVYVSEWQPENLDITPYKNKTTFLFTNLSKNRSQNDYRNIIGELNICAILPNDNPLKIHEPLFNRDDFAESHAVCMQALNGSVQEDIMVKSDDESSNDTQYCIPGAFVPAMFSDYEFADIQEMLEGKDNNNVLYYRKKNVCEPYSIWTWEDTNILDDEEYWYDGDAYYYVETETMQVGQILLNGAEACEQTIGDLPKQEFDISGWQIQKQVSNIPERECLYNKKITIAAQLDSDLKPIPSEVYQYTDNNDAEYVDGDGNIWGGVNANAGCKQLLAFWSEVDE